MNKKKNSICYHAMQESIEMGESLTSHISTNCNLADTLTKTLFGKNKRGVVEVVLYGVFESFVYPICYNINPKKLLKRA